MRDVLHHSGICVMNPRRKTKIKIDIKIFEEKIAKNFPNFIKNVNLQI